MPLEGWFWLVLDAILIALLIRQIRLFSKEMVIPDRWPHVVSEQGAPREGDHADKPQSR